MSRSASTPKKKTGPYRFLRTPQLADEMNLSQDAIRKLAEWGAPFIAQKSHPELLFEWIKQNPGKIGKLE